ncbi:penicillin acylase family protein [Hydrogenophaga sp. 5NK40-0174]|uniref:penicillin acylase family protein n=1 Tax=Hydrogenophaga sp. 5NK40-0174 TaxID=3127649 RepID=UPI003105BEA1
MKWLNRALLSVVMVLLLTGAVLAVYGRKTLPLMNGQLSLPGLKHPVLVTRDASDVTHVEAQDPRDAWMALGYVHAQERPWQMAFNRRLMRGRLSEILGPATLPTDQTLLTLGVRRAALAQLEGASPEVVSALEAYSAGVNAFFADSRQALPPEFLLTGDDPRPLAREGLFWDVGDSAAWVLLMSLDLGKNWSDELIRWRVARDLDTSAVHELLPPYDDEQPASSADLSALYRELGVYRAERATAGAAVPSTLAGLSMEELIASGGKGSNNWVVDGSRSTTGKPLLANDPHLSIGAPAIWYFAHLRAPAVDGFDALDVVGASLPGTPYVVLGHTQGAAWGYTNTGPDTQDLYLEQLHPDDPDRYRLPDAPDGTPRWASFEVEEVGIPVKGQGEVHYRVRRSRHGPVVSDVEGKTRDLLDTGRYALALRWSALDADNGTMQAFSAINRAQSVPALQAAFRDFHSPMQNVVMADIHGRIAYKAAGRVPVRADNNDIMGKAPAPGWLPQYDWVSWIPYEETPQDDGANGWIATANQRIHELDYPYFIAQDWRPDYRKKRIDALLGETEKHSVESFARIQSDLLSAGALKLMPFLRKAAGQSTHPMAPSAREVIERFDGVMNADAAGPLVFHAWYDAFLRQTVGQRLGQDTFDALYGKRLFSEAVEGILLRADDRWCGAGGCDAVSVAAFDEAMERVAAWQGRDVSRWQWGRAHPAISSHRPFSVVPAVAGLFEVAVPTGGDSHTVNVGEYRAHHDAMPFASRLAPSLRAIYDLSDLNNSRFIYQTGQNGSVFSPRYADMKHEWADVRYRKLSTDTAAPRSKLILTP